MPGCLPQSAAQHAQRGAGAGLGHRWACQETKMLHPLNIPTCASNEWSRSPGLLLLLLLLAAASAAPLASAPLASAAKKPRVAATCQANATMVPEAEDCAPSSSACSSAALQQRSMSCRSVGRCCTARVAPRPRACVAAPPAPPPPLRPPPPGAAGQGLYTQEELCSSVAAPAAAAAAAAAAFVGRPRPRLGGSALETQAGAAARGGRSRGGSRAWRALQGAGRVGHCPAINSTCKQQGLAALWHTHPGGRGRALSTAPAPGRCP